MWEKGKFVHSWRKFKLGNYDPEGAGVPGELMPGGVAELLGSGCFFPPVASITLPFPCAMRIITVITVVTMIITCV